MHGLAYGTASNTQDAEDLLYQRFVLREVRNFNLPVPNLREGSWAQAHLPPPSPPSPKTLDHH